MSAVTQHTAPSSFPTDPTEPQERDLTDSAAVRERDEAGTRRPSGPAEGHTGRRSALVVAASLLAGLVAALALVLGPFAGDREAVITGAFLLGFAVGWALLAVLSERFTDRPQRWAAVPAAAMALTGLGLVVLAPGDGALTALGWAWPPLLLALVVWMIVQARRRPSGRAESWLLYPVFGVLAIAAIGGAYETVRNATDPAPAVLAGSRLIDVGGHRLSIRCIGSGSPTVVLEPGLGETASAMARWIAPEVARTTTVCAYDRAGHARSDDAVAGSADAARDLDVLLARAHVPRPYVLAGHSLGGMFALSYAHRYPAQVAGVVLLDSMHPRQHNAFAGTDRFLAVLPTLARMGVARLLADPKDGRPTKQAAAFVRDVDDMPAQLDRAAKLTSLGNRPLSVLTAGTDAEPGWTGEQNDLAKLSTDSTHRTVGRATHQSLIDEKRYAAQSSRAIDDVVKAVQRSG
jgi:pimeloyl-ACP methyl ester carboxylesterase